MHAMRGGHGKGRQADDGAALGRAAAAGADPGHERRLNLWPEASRDGPGQNGAEAFPRGSDVISISAQRNPIVMPPQAETHASTTFVAEAQWVPAGARLA